MDTITEKEYRRIIKQYKQLVDLILAKTEQLALIERGRRNYLPLAFLFDENYPEKYKVIFEEEKRKKEQEKKRKQEEKEKKMEAFERSEYERLKKKFEGDLHGKRE